MYQPPFIRDLTPCLPNQIYVCINMNPKRKMYAHELWHFIRISVLAPLSIYKLLLTSDV